MSSQTGVELQNFQNELTVPRLPYQSTEALYKDQGINASLDNDRPEMYIGVFSEQYRPRRHFIVQASSLGLHHPNWPETPLGLSLPLHDIDELCQRGDVITSNSKEHPIILEIRKLGTYPSGWNRPDTVAPSVAAVNDAEQFARNQDFESIHLPSISAADDGEINFWWDKDGLYIDLGFFGDGSYSFYARLPNGKEIVVDHAPLFQPLSPEILQFLKKSG